MKGNQCLSCRSLYLLLYEDESMKDMAEKVLGYILWLLEEVQKPVKALEESREIKRVRSGDLAGKKN